MTRINDRRPHGTMDHPTRLFVMRSGDIKVVAAELTGHEEVGRIEGHLASEGGVMIKNGGSPACWVR